MLDQIQDILGNSHFEAYVGGPIAGVVAAAIFSALGTQPGPNAGTQSPRDIYIQIVHQYGQGSPVGRGSGSNHGGGDGSDLNPVIVAGLACLVVGFLFAAYLPQISTALCFFITCVATFSIASCLFAIFRGQFNTLAWWQHTIFPFLASMACLLVVFKAEQAISQNVISFAQSLLGSDRLTFSRILNGAITFYKSLNNDYVQWISFQMGAFMLALLSTLATFLQCIHYIALANARTSSSYFRVKLVTLTMRFSGARPIISVTVFLLLAWLFASGDAYQFFHQ